MYRAAIALGALVLVAGCSEKREPIGYSLNGVSIYHNDVDGNVTAWSPGVNIEGEKTVVYYAVGDQKDTRPVKPIWQKSCVGIGPGTSEVPRCNRMRCFDGDKEIPMRADKAGRLYCGPAPRSRR